MTGGLTEVTLGAAGMEYLKDQLAGGKTLSHLLLRRADLDEGRLIALLPAGTPEVTANRLTASAAMRAKVSVLVVANMVAQFLRETHDGICIFEDAEARSNDPFLSRLATPFVTFGDEVYHTVASPEVADIEETMASAESSWLLVGVLSVKQGAFVRREVITEVVLSGIAERAHRIILSAYDGEGYVIWLSPSQQGLAAARQIV